ncbi:MAG: Asp23/Gls24 family envelope stress response protein [Eubacteriales bacterium]|nr:Asp23/Gls24 family envelope stress response protein [Eubacteriales bacterium]MDD3199532.1 Asp23/Gls24 family envelope stress response protein [Eubacteriales bacterium]MDD4122245.1 Asp23/Gls24 family envelope stress response protein [Eubacteriales bacterium]MDD4629861.1 Asp23/Gls24 family envelope stress response protein [Eubacteriales bacterium]
MNTGAEEKLGTIKITDDVIAVCAMNATRKTNGVARLSSVFSDNISKNIFGKEPLYKGIKVNQNEEGISIDIYIIAEYGVKIPEVAWDIQENVKREVENMTDAAVKAVNIHVQGVHFADEED